jgi:hypothetical protein
MERRVRAARLRALGALTILGEVTEIEKWLGRHRLALQKEKQRRVIGQGSNTPTASSDLAALF